MGIRTKWGRLGEFLERSRGGQYKEGPNSFLWPSLALSCPPPKVGLDSSLLARVQEARRGQESHPSFLNRQHHALSPPTTVPRK